VCRDVIKIELDQRRAHCDLVTYLYPRGETLALQRDSIDAHMHQHLDVASYLQRHRVTGSMLL